MTALRELESKLGRQKLLILAVVVLFWVAGFSAVLNRVPSLRYKSDFFLRWYASEKYLTEGRNIYDFANGSEAQAIMYQGAPAPYLTNYYYPAPLLLVTAPLARLPYPTAHFIWTAVGQLLFLLAVAVLVWILKYPSNSNQVALLMVLLMLWIPYFQHAVWAQFNTIGMLSLALSYALLRQGRFGLAGAMAAGLLLKPHATALSLAFLIGYALFRPWRFRFVGGFAAACALLWGSGELLQPGWVADFFGSAGSYIPTYSLVDEIWNPYYSVTALLLILAVAVFIRNRQAPVDSVRFAAAAALSMSIWIMVVPITWTFHLVLLAIALPLLLSGYRRRFPRQHRRIVFFFVANFLLGWAAYIIGLVRPDWSVLHNFWGEASFRLVEPVALTLLGLPLALAKEDEDAS